MASGARGFGLICICAVMKDAAMSIHAASEVPENQLDDKDSTSLIPINSGGDTSTDSSGAPELGSTPDNTEAPESGSTPEPSEEPEPGSTPDTTEEPEPGSTPDTSEEPEPGSTPDTTEELSPAEPEPGSTPEPSEEPEPGSTPDTTEEPEPGSTPDTSEEPEPGSTPDTTEEPEPGSTPEPSEEPEPGSTPDTTEEPEAGSTPEPSEEPESGSTPEPSGTTESPGVSSQTTSTGPQDPCKLKPCGGSASCVNLHSERLCLCSEGSYYQESSCVKALECPASCSAEDRKQCLKNGDGPLECACMPDYQKSTDGKCEPLLHLLQSQALSSSTESGFLELQHEIFASVISP
ncbi:hypothetical protein U0070_024693 [Myodes glareolus]|uniref:EGF-like domain-containing protein n=1 Tax=Myodes glareolus TaxID=447135 RepID=A0AAW0HQF0_MYOGA